MARMNRMETAKQCVCGRGVAMAFAFIKLRSLALGNLAARLG